jgi:hypothetical protein
MHTQPVDNVRPRCKRLWTPAQVCFVALPRYVLYMRRAELKAHVACILLLGKYGMPACQRLQSLASPLRVFIPSPLHRRRLLHESSLYPQHHALRLHP